MVYSDKILSIDFSSRKVKVAIVSDKLELESVSTQEYEIIDEDIDGFAKRFEMDKIWNKIKVGIKNVIKENKPDRIIGISSCAQRIATVFLDKKGMEIYGGPNTDLRGIDSAYLIEDEYSEEELFTITAHSPSLMFTLARLLWFREEEKNKYDDIGKILMLDDWIGYKLSGLSFTDYTSIGASQLFDIKKNKWSMEIIENFNINPQILPEITDSGMIIGDLKSDLRREFNLKQEKIPIIKGCGDTQANLLGMGAVEPGVIGISLGTTAPVNLVVNKPLIDPNLNFWTECHVKKGTWLIEANAGGTGRAYDWFKDTFVRDSQGDVNEIINNYLSNIEPGAGSTFAYLGPELMAVKDQTSIKRGVFVFQPPSMIGEELPKLEHFARSVIEGICFGILENYLALQQFSPSKPITFCGGGMSKSKEFCKILANILNTELTVPYTKESAFIGNAINTLLGLNLYSDYKKIYDDLMKFEIFSADQSISKEYQSIFTQWKNLKNKIDQL
ncbi:MAG: FGGY-family carbohydrate kinase [Candidatus Lokiarchaeota archaeon]|nr:FGGY-family carbohydrate kinase [Candidatus Lokiarchaeota archaeon]